MKVYSSFSQAIRAGIPLIRQQAYSHYFVTNQLGMVRACVLGTGAYAMYLNDIGWKRVNLPAIRAALVQQAIRYHPYLSTTRVNCPARFSLRHLFMPKFVVHNQSLVTLCIHLNDVHHWSRERIADWLEKEEEKLGFVTLVEKETKDVGVQIESSIGLVKV